LLYFNDLYVLIPDLNMHVVNLLTWRIAMESHCMLPVIEVICTEVKIDQLDSLLVCRCLDSDVDVHRPFDRDDVLFVAWIAVLFVFAFHWLPLLVVG